MRYIGDPVAAVAALTRDQAVAAAAAVKVEYELLPVLDTFEKALAADAVPHPRGPAQPLLPAAA